jgi:hypothetical protein
MLARPVSHVPTGVRLCLLLALGLQLGWHSLHLNERPRADALPPAPSLAALRLASVGEPVAMSKLTMLYLQQYDDQAGVSLSLGQLDYSRVEQWLDRALGLDERGQAPLLAASQVYGAVGDAQRVRSMLDFVYRNFSADPNRRWPWLAHAALVAKHRLHDLPLARSYARAIREQATGPTVPAWARELEVFVLEDMNELDSAKALIGGMLASGSVTDPNELRFLSDRLDAIAARQAATSAADVTPAQH